MDVAGHTRNYRRGAIMGLTLAEAFILLAFVLLLLFAFWQSETDKENTPAVQTLKQLPPESQQAVVDASKDGSLESCADLKQQGFDIGKLAGSGVYPEDFERFIDKDDVQRLLKAASRLPEDVQRDLADMVESERAHEVLSQMAILEKLVEAAQQLDLAKLANAMAEDGRTARDVKEILDNWDGIYGRLQDHENQRAALAEALMDELGDLVTGFGGKIEGTTIELPKQVLFARGKADITESTAEILSQICVPWLRVLTDAEIEISEVRIEGHASSDWKSARTPHEAYLNNLDLSQRRSQAVLRYCLGRVQAPEIRTWAHSHLIAVGYSSVQTKLDDGEEDRHASRRVELNVVDRKPQIETISSESQNSADLH